MAPQGVEKAPSPSLYQILDKPLYDLDEIIQSKAGATISEIVAQEGESGFRIHEAQALCNVLSQPDGIIALGGGALLLPDNRRAVEEAGPILVLSASLNTLLDRLIQAPTQRPLLSGADRESRSVNNPSGASQDQIKGHLETLLLQRHAHYQSFPLHLSTDHLQMEQVAWESLIALGTLHIKGMTDGGYDVLVQEGNLQTLGKALQSRHLRGPMVGCRRRGHARAAV